MAFRFQITPSARAVLDSWAKNASFAGHVPTIVWTGDADAKNWGWSVGTYVRDQVPVSAIVTLDGVEFVVEEMFRDRLQDKTLDYVNGHFAVRD